MRLRLVFLILLTALPCSHISFGQTLTEQLINEDAAKLVQQAREKGDIVRGAILFHQGKLNCAKCHRPTAEKDRIGPDLSRLGPDISDVSIVESILLPSKEIKDNYKTVTALTVDGDVIDGMIVKEDDHAITIRDRENVDNLITVDRDDIDEVKPGKLSSMPAELANELKNRKQFLDLLRYVIDIKERGPDAESVKSAGATVRKLEGELEGLVAIQKYSCTACHVETRQLPQSVLATKKAPNLKWSAQNLNPNYIQAFISNPQSTKHGSTMPDLFGGLNESMRRKSAVAITNYLVAESNNNYKLQSIDETAASRGYTMFHSVGCVACHSPRGRHADENALPGSTPMGKLGGKYSIDALVSFLENPLSVRASGHMPDMQLTHREAIDIANFLLQDSFDESEKKFQLDSTTVEMGKSLFGQMNCAKCHSDFDKGIEQPATEFIALDQLESSKGCLSGKTGSWPSFTFEENDIENIRSALNVTAENLSNENLISVTLRNYNCIACHRRNDLGGVPMDRNHHFTTTNLNLGDQGRLPPALTGIGSKLKPKWMRDVLVNRRTIRPYMNTRMPQYGEENIGHLVDLFQTSDQLAQSTSFAEFKDQKETRKWGLELVGNKGLNCVACHTYKYKLSDTMPAVDLTEMAQRLKKDWFYRYMLDPQKFSPNTVMPSFWPGGNAIRRDIQGSPEDQIEAIWQYLIDGRQAHTPRGVVREPLEIVVTSEAQMLRRKYPGIGKRGIGVGYPGGVNLAFDAEQMRLAMVWSGKFADPGGVWTGQGSGQVRPMGKTISFAKGPDIDLLTTPWKADDGRPPNHKFKGYRLDQLQRPTFLYEINRTKIEDYFMELEVDDKQMVGLARKVTFKGSAEETQLRVRLATGEIKMIENAFVVDDRLTIKIQSNQPPIIDDQELYIPITLTEGEQQLGIQYIWKST